MVTLPGQGTRDAKLTCLRPAQAAQAAQAATVPMPT
jgi:hypothetical protein